MDLARLLLMTSSSGHAVFVVSYQSGCDLPRLSLPQANKRTRGAVDLEGRYMATCAHLPVAVEARVCVVTKEIMELWCTERNCLLS